MLFKHICLKSIHAFCCFIYLQLLKLHHQEAYFPVYSGCVFCIWSFISASWDFPWQIFVKKLFFLLTRTTFTVFKFLQKFLFWNSKFFNLISFTLIWCLLEPKENRTASALKSSQQLYKFSLFGNNWILIKWSKCINIRIQSN